MRNTSTLILAGLLIAATVSMSGCGGNATLFNPAFINQYNGSYFPRTPGPTAPYVLVRVVNTTPQTAEFVVTVERDELVTDDQGGYIIDEYGNFATRRELETVRLQTGEEGRAAETGSLFSCSPSPIVRVGLGENLLPSDQAVFIGGGGAQGDAGFGVQAGDLEPLSIEVGNFNCGDTIIFRLFESSGAPGGVKLESFLLPGSEQPSIFNGPTTFENYDAFLTEQAREYEE